MDRAFRVAGAFDTETTNFGNPIEGIVAFPTLYQLGTLNAPVEDITPDNVREHVSISTFRNHDKLYRALDRLRGQGDDVPVILVHNLGFDMYALAPYLVRNDVKVLAKTAKKPISLQVLGEDGNPELVFLDTLGLFMKSLAALGHECGMPKLDGSWDYDLIRCPQTPLADDEMEYAKGDIRTLLCYMGHFLRANPDISPAEIGFRVQTKTGVVRTKRAVHVGSVHGKYLSRKVNQYWHLQNQTQRPKTNDELFTMHAATRGGFTFCARNHASKVWHATDDMRILSYDSTSQHPAQMASHLYPIDFKQADSEQLLAAFEIAANVPLERVLDYWLKPFPYAFHACYVFDNLRPKPDSVFERDGIFPLASARISGKAPVFDNEHSAAFKDSIAELGYKDAASGGVYAFGKLEQAQVAKLFLTELEAWVMAQCYEWDGVQAIGGYMSSTFRKPSDMSVLSIMRFYKAKNALKEFMGSYTPNTVNDAGKLKGLFPEVFVDDCAMGAATRDEVRQQYMLAKADLNSLFGVEATNECRRDYELHGADGFELVGTDGLHNLPRASKCTYQYGQRIVGWSRVAQVVIMLLCAPFTQAIVCGDTDSLKMVVKSCDVKGMEKRLRYHASKLDGAKTLATKRARDCYPEQFDPLEGIGHYVLDGEYDAFCAAWNKGYVALEGGSVHCTIAGIPTSRRTSADVHDSYNDFFDVLMREGMAFDGVAALAVGYNVTIDYSITKLNGRYHPANFGDYIDMDVTDHLGDTHHVKAPQALALAPMFKTLGDTANPENRRNSVIALQNNPGVNVKPVWLKWRNGRAIIEYQHL